MIEPYMLSDASCRKLSEIIEIESDRGLAVVIIVAGEDGASIQANVNSDTVGEMLLDVIANWNDKTEEKL